MSAPPEISGDPPTFDGAVCEGLMCEQYFYGGRLVSPANVAWIMLCGVWYRFFFDCGVLYWRRGDGLPRSYDLPELSGEVQLFDLGTAYGLLGKPVFLTQEACGVTMRVCLEFLPSGQVVFSHCGNETIFTYTA